MSAGWYKNEAGLITNNWSGTVVEYQEQLSMVNFEDYIAEGSGTEEVQRKPVLKVGRVHEETLISDKAIAALSILSVAAVAGGWLLKNSRYLSGLRAR